MSSHSSGRTSRRSRSGTLAPGRGAHGSSGDGDHGDTPGGRRAPCNHSLCTSYSSSDTSYWTSYRTHRRLFHNAQCATPVLPVTFLASLSLFYDLQDPVVATLLAPAAVVVVRVIIIAVLARLLLSRKWVEDPS